MSTLPVSCTSPLNVKAFSSRPFLDRAEAGIDLAKCCQETGTSPESLILALPRGGVPVAAEMAKILRLPLDVFLVRRFSLPSRPDQPAGIIGSGGVHQLFHGFTLSSEVKAVIEREKDGIVRRERSYRQSRPSKLITGRSVIVVDDGLTTGATMRNAVLALRRHRPARITAAVPVASPEVCADLALHADSVVCARTPHSFFSVRRCYTDFSPVLDSDIRDLLDSVDAAAFPRAFHA